MNYQQKRRCFVLSLSLLPILTACSQEVTNQTGIWERVLFFFAEMIGLLSFGRSIGLGIILLTILLRLLLLPLYQMQLRSTQKMQDLQPELKALQQTYRGRENRFKLAQESQALYQKHGVNPYAAMLPLVIQMPILIALYQALTRIDFLKQGQFLWLNLAEPDRLFLLPLLAAFLTGLSTWLTNKAQKEANTMMTLMTYLLPFMILLMALNLASGAVLYWTVSNAFQVAQILLLNNPFKQMRMRQEKQAQARALEARKRRAMKKSRKRR